MDSADTTPPEETTGREAYYEAALINIILWCDECKSTLDPDHDLGPDKSFHSDGYFVLLGDEAFERGWQIDFGGEHGFKIRCPRCVGCRS